MAVSYKFNGANLDALNMRFLEAVGQKNAERASHYVDSGANINVRDDKDDTALLRAVRDGDTAMALMLISKKASLDAQDKEGATALIIAARRNDVGLCRALIEAHADIMIDDRAGKKALDYAMRTANPELVLLFEAPLMQKLSTIGSSDLAQKLRMSQVNLDDVDPTTGETMLTWAASQKGQESVALAFIEAGAKVDAPNRDGKTPRQVARETGNSDMLKLLDEAQKHRPDIFKDQRPGTKPLFPNNVRT